MRALPLAIGGVADHVHLLVRFPTSVSLARLVQQLKGSSSHLVNHLHPEVRRRFRWQGGYSAFTLARRDVPAVSRYILRQEEHHRSRKLSPALESLPEA
jgi:putative transposase